MRFKVKLPGSSKYLFVTDDHREPTLGSLKEATARAFQTLGMTGLDFEMSLNGNDAVEGNEETTLSAAGIVSGDIIRIIAKEELRGEFMEAGKELDSGETVDNERPVTSRNSSDMISNDATQPSSPPRTIDGGTPIDAREVNRCLTEPVLCRESTSSQVPDMLQQWYKTSDVASMNDAFVVVLHVMMLESGYEQKSFNQDASSILSAETKLGNIYKIFYYHKSCPEGSICLTCIPMGSLVTINGTYKTTTFHLNLKPATFVRKGPYKAENPAFIYSKLSKLSHVFKDAIVQPLLTVLQAGEGVPSSCGIGSLSTEVKFIILNFLNAPSLLNTSECCKEFYELADQQSIWKRLCFSDFPESLSEKFRDDEHITWKEKYQALYKKKKMRRNHPRFLGPSPFAVPLPGMFPYLDPFGSRLFMPQGIVGGEFDRIPGIPVPLRPDLGLPPFLPPPPPGPRMLPDGRFPFLNRRNAPRWPGYFPGYY